MTLFQFMQDEERTDWPKWNYYGQAFPIRLLTNPEWSIEFIREYFIRGQKRMAVAEIFDPQLLSLHNQLCLSRNGRTSIPGWANALSELPEFRAIHTVSAFFLGVWLEDQIMNGRGKLDIHMDRQGYPFSYLWFLLCLYHDYGYIIEKNPMLCDKLEHRKKRSPYGNSYFYILSELKCDLQIDLSPYHGTRACKKSPGGKWLEPIEPTLEQQALLQLMELSSDLENSVVFDCGIQVKPFTYSCKLISNYFAYCAQEGTGFPKAYDHGIIGGYLFYDRMIKNYLSAYMRSHDLNQAGFLDLNYFIYNEKVFDYHQLPIFKHIADCIIAHNIWRADPAKEEQCRLYKKYFLEPLIGDAFQKTSFRKNPLLFLLSIVDSLEPYKVYCTENMPAKKALSVWHAIDLSYDSDYLTITSKKNGYPIHPLYTKAQGLKDWLDVGPAEMNATGDGFSIKIF